jgi:hypothetical protein
VTKYRRKGNGASAELDAIAPKEDEEQKTLFEWAELQAGKWPELRRMMHSPNGGSRNAIEGAKFKAMGVRAGFPDVFLPARRQTAEGGTYGGLFVELKRRAGGRLSPEQREWLEYLWEAGYYAVCCGGWEEAVRHIDFYLRLKKPGKEEKE